MPIELTALGWIPANLATFREPWPEDFDRRTHLVAEGLGTP